jgi:hypothetical protein
MASKNKPVPTQGLFVKDTSSTTPGNPVGLNAAQYDGVIFPVASRAPATYTSNPYFAADVSGVRLYINLTVVNGGTLTVKIQTFDPASQTWVDIPLAVTTALAAVAVTTLTVYPGVTETANQDIANPLGVLWRVSATTGTAAVTFGIGGEYLG